MNCSTSSNPWKASTRQGSPGQGFLLCSVNSNPSIKMKTGIGVQKTIATRIMEKRQREAAKALDASQHHGDAPPPVETVRVGEGKRPSVIAGAPGEGGIVVAPGEGGPDKGGPGEGGIVVAPGEGGPAKGGPQSKAALLVNPDATTEHVGKPKSATGGSLPGAASPNDWSKGATECLAKLSQLGSSTVQQVTEKVRQLKDNEDRLKRTHEDMELTIRDKMGTIQHLEEETQGLASELSQLEKTSKDVTELMREPTWKDKRQAREKANASEVVRSHEKDYDAVTSEFERLGDELRQLNNNKKSNAGIQEKQLLGKQLVDLLRKQQRLSQRLEEADQQEYAASLTQITSDRSKAIFDLDPHASQRKEESSERKRIEKQLQTLEAALKTARGEASSAKKDAGDKLNIQLLQRTSLIEKLQTLCTPRPRTLHTNPTDPSSFRFLQVPKPPDVNNPATTSIVSQCPKAKEDTEQKGSPPQTFEARQWQIIPSSVATPDHKENLFVYHDMGSGKTCTVVLCIVQLAAYYLRTLPNPQPGATKGRPKDPLPICLVLVHTVSALTGYTEALEKEGCGQNLVAQLRANPTEDAAQGLPVVELHTKRTKSQMTNKVSVWTFRVDKKVYFKVIFKVMTHTLTGKISEKEKAHDFGDDSQLPKKGVVIVDEAHKLWEGAAESTLGKTRAELRNRLLDKKGGNKSLKLILLTGTPTKGDLWQLMALLTLLAQKSLASKGQTWEKSIPPQVTNSPELNVKANGHWENELFRKTHDGVWGWKPTKQEWLGDQLRGTTSYVTLVNDPTLYPRFGVKLFVLLAKPGGAAKEDDRAGGESPPDKDTGKTAARRLYNNSTGLVLRQSAENPELFDEEPLGEHNRYVLVKTQPQDSLVQKVKAKKKKDVESHQIFREYQGDNGVRPPAWHAFFSLAKSNKDGEKHFMFFEPKNATTKQAFFAAFQQEVLEDNVEVIDWCKFGGWTPAAAGQGKTKNQLVEALKEAQKNSQKKRPLAVDISCGGDGIPLFAQIFNDTKHNQGGKLIRWVFGGTLNKEGLSLFNTRYVHILTPLATGGDLQQTVRRVTRFCSMSGYTNPLEEWIATVLLYCVAIDNTCCKEASCDKAATWNPILAGEEVTPVSLVLDLLKQQAMDCEALKDLNQTNLGCAHPYAPLEQGNLCYKFWDEELPRTTIDCTGKDRTLSVPRSMKDTLTPETYAVMTMIEAIFEIFERGGGVEALLNSPPLETQLQESFELKENESAGDLIHRIFPSDKDLFPQAKRLQRNTEAFPPRWRLALALLRYFRATAGLLPPEKVKELKNQTRKDTDLFGEYLQLHVDENKLPEAATAKALHDRIVEATEQWKTQLAGALTEDG